MKSLIEGLPPEIAQRIHPDWRKNEADYWARRDELLIQYRDQWIGYANGRVIVAGSSPVEILHKAQEADEHPFVTCVGREHEPSRMRRVAFAYDTTYAGEPIPVVAAEFRKHVGAPGLVLQGVIPDTGADADFTGRERNLGRDVLSRVEVLFRGPARESRDQSLTTRLIARRSHIIVSGPAPSGRSITRRAI